MIHCLRVVVAKVALGLPVELEVAFPVPVNGVTCIVVVVVVVVEVASHSSSISVSVLIVDAIVTCERKQTFTSVSGHVYRLNLDVVQFQIIYLLHSSPCYELKLVITRLQLAI